MLVAVTIGLPLQNRLGIKDRACAGASPWACHLTASAPIERPGERVTANSSLGLQFDNKKNARLNAFFSPASTGTGAAAAEKEAERGA